MRKLGTFWQANICKVNQFGNRIKRLREHKSMLQRQVAAMLDIDTPMLSKIERGERNAKRDQVISLSKIYDVAEEELLSLWLSDQLLDILKDEKVALKALSVTMDAIHKK